jgi:glycerol-3-phosphate dehydrogenase
MDCCQDEAGKVRGAVCRNQITGEEFSVRAKCVINATGPFTDAIR